MFDINKEIDDFQNELISYQSMADPDVNELITHLRDESEMLIKKGLTEEESFWIARHRLGDTKVIHTEFSKVNQATIWRNRMLWLFLGYFLFTMIPSIVTLITIPFYLIDIKWIFFTTPIYGDNFPVPIPLFILCLMIIGGIFYLISTQNNKSIRNKFSHLTTIPKFNMGYKIVLVILGFYLIAIFSDLFSSIVLARSYDVATIEKINASGSIFSLFWNIFLFLSLSTFMFLIVKRKNKNIVA